MAIVSISHAAKLVRKGRQTLYNHNDKGKLTFTKTPDGKPGIDTSELIRVYGKIYMPAEQYETAIQDSSEYLDTVRQVKNDSAPGQGGVQNDMSKSVSGAQNRVSNTVSLNDDTASALSWFMEQVDETKQELAETRAELEDKENRLAELREAMDKLPSPESVEQRLKEQAEKLKQQHQSALEAERVQQARRLAEQKQHEVAQAEKWELAIADRKQEIKRAKAEADELRHREQEHAKALKAERDRVSALESRGLIARLFNKKPEPAG